MVELDQVILSSVGGLLVQALVAYALARVRREGKVRDGWLVLRYNGAIMALPAFIIGGGLFLTISVEFVGIGRPQNPEEVGPVLLLFLLGLIAPGSLMATHVFVIAFEANETGVRQRSPWAASFFIRWDDITSIRHDRRFERHVIESPGGVMRVSDALDGAGDFAALAKRMVPEERWRGGERKPK